MKNNKKQISLFEEQNVEPNNSKKNPKSSSASHPPNKQKDSILIKYGPGVPAWKHKGVLDIEVLDKIEWEQREFYEIFKENFDKGIFLELEGSDTYALTFLLELATECLKGSDFATLQNSTAQIGKLYPNTVMMGNMICSEVMDVLNARASKEDRNSRRQGGFRDYDYGYSNYEWGTRFKKKLKLNPQQARHLDYLDYPINAFFEIEACALETIRLYFTAMQGLSRTTFYEKFTYEDVLETVLGEHLEAVREELEWDYFDENYESEFVLKEFSINILRFCENAVREHYGHKRKLNLEMVFSRTDRGAQFEDDVYFVLQKIAERLVPEIKPPDLQTDTKLYEINPTRWKAKLEKFIADYQDDPNLFHDRVLTLAAMNKKSRTLEKIYFDASKFMARQNSLVALDLYFRGFYFDRRPINYPDKFFGKALQKKLFPTPEHLYIVLNLVLDFVRDKNLDKALTVLSEHYTKPPSLPKKKIRLDSEQIRQVQEEHSGTVRLLNEYLADEEEAAPPPMPAARKPKSPKAKPAPKDGATRSIFSEAIAFTPVQIKALELFSQPDLSVAQSDLQAFAKSEGVFLNRLIDGINDLCYEILDDILIEEEEAYTILPDHYQKILAK